MSRQLLDFVARLEGVREIGADRYRARCPAHGSRGQTLAVGLGDNGGVLLYCHAGCSVDAIVSAVGMQISDLYPDRSDDPGGRHRRATKHRPDWRRVCRTLCHELNVVEVALSDLERGRPLSPGDHARLRETLDTTAAVRRLIDAHA